MCRNIRQLHNFEPPATTDEVQAAAMQYVRKVSGATRPSQANAEAFDLAVHEVAEATQRLLDSLVTTAPPKDREVEAAKARARAAAALRHVRPGSEATDEHVVGELRVDLGGLAAGADQHALGPLGRTHVAVRQRTHPAQRCHQDLVLLDLLADPPDPQPHLHAVGDRGRQRLDARP